MVFQLIKRDQPKAEPRRSSHLEDLFSEAENFGLVRVSSRSDKPPQERYWVTIEFSTLPGTMLKAESDFGMGLHDAFQMAIARAEKIRDQFK